MFDINSLSKVLDPFPEDVKEKVKEAMKQQFSGKTGELNTNTMAKFGLTMPVSGQTTEAAATPSEEAAQNQTDEASELKVDESEQLEHRNQKKT